MSDQYQVAPLAALDGSMRSTRTPDAIHSPLSYLRADQDVYKTSLSNPGSSNRLLSSGEDNSGKHNRAQADSDWGEDAPGRPPPSASDAPPGEKRFMLQPSTTAPFLSESQNSPAAAPHRPQGDPERELNPKEAIDEMDRTVTAAHNAVLLAQRLALLGQLSTVVGLLVVQEDDERKAIVTQREVVVSSFIPLDPERFDRNKVLVAEDDARAIVSHAEFTAHRELYELETDASAETRFRMQKHVRQECRVLDAKATFGVLRLVEASSSDAAILKKQEQKERRATEIQASGRRKVEQEEAEGRAAFADNWQVRFSQLHRRFASTHSELDAIQEAYAEAIELQRVEIEKQRTEELRLAAVGAMENRKRLERENVEHAEVIARRTVFTTETSTFEDILRLHRFQAVSIDA